MKENLRGENEGAKGEIVRLASARATRETWAIVLLSLVLTVLGGQAGVAELIVQGSPNLVNYQGTLYLASDGTTPVTGHQNLVFRLYPTANGVTPVWAELHQDVRVANGSFSVFLGAGEEAEGEPHGLLEETFQTAPLWLGVTVGLDAELPQRQLITSVPYALTATSVTTATHGVPPGTIVMFAGPTVPPGWVRCDGTPYDGTQPQYAALYAAIEDTWGISDAGFQVPDFRGWTPIGRTGVTRPTGITARPTVGQEVGENPVALAKAEIPTHTHGYYDRYINSRYSLKLMGGAYYSVDNATAIPPTVDTDPNTPANGSHNNVQPSTYVYFIIKL